MVVRIDNENGFHASDTPPYEMTSLEFYWREKYRYSDTVTLEEWRVLRHKAKQKGLDSE